MIDGVSIICCTYNGRNRLPAALDAISKIDFNGKWQLIVVDNASTDGTSEYLKESLPSISLDVELLFCPTPGKNFALWAAFKKVKYSYILICDDDNLLFPDYLTIGHKILNNNSKIGALGGKGIAPKDLILPDWFDDYQSTYAIGPQAKENGPIEKGYGLYGAGCFFRFDVIKKLIDKDFNPSSKALRGKMITGGEDIEMCLAIECLGYEIWFNDQLCFYHAIEEHRLSWEYLLNLKASIASNFPLMEPYKYFIFKDSSIYTLFVFKRVPRLFWNFIFTQVLYMIRPKPKNRIFRKVYAHTVKGLFKNYHISHKAYKNMKSILA